MVFYPYGSYPSKNKPSKDKARHKEKSIGMASKKRERENDIYNTDGKIHLSHTTARSRSMILQSLEILKSLEP